MKKLKLYKDFEIKRRKESHFFESNIDEFTECVNDILLEIQDDGFQIEMSEFHKDDDSLVLEVCITRSLRSLHKSFFWKDVKDSIIRLNEWYYGYSGNELTPGINGKTIKELAKIGIRYKSNSPFRMFSSIPKPTWPISESDEFGIGWYKPEDFDNLPDFTSFTILRIEMKLSKKLI